MTKITTDKGNDYYILYSDHTRQRVILCEKYDRPIYNGRDERVLNCTPDELLPLMNRLGF